MDTTILIAILCILVGVLIGLLLFKKNGKDIMKTDKKPKQPKEKKQPMEFSKKILIVTALVTLFIILSAVSMSYMTQTTDVYAYLIPSIFGSLSIGLGFYYNKAKAENILKIKGSHGDDAAELARKAMNNEDY